MKASESPQIATLEAYPMMHHGYWLERNFDTGTGNAPQYKYEGPPRALYIRDFRMQINFWTVVDPATEFADTALFLRLIHAFYITRYHDIIDSSADDPHTPEDWVPSIVPNLFLRDFGRIDPTTVSGAYDLLSPYYELHGPTGNTAYPQRHASAQVLRSWNWLMPIGEINLERGEVSHRSFSIRIPRFRLNHDQMLCFLMNSLNSHQLTDVDVAFSVYGTFRYKVFNREERSTPGEALEISI